MLLPNGSFQLVEALGLYHTLVGGTFTTNTIRYMDPTLNDSQVRVTVKMHHVETQPTNILAKIKFWQVTRGRYSKVIYEQELATRACLRFDTHINNEYVLYDNDVSDFLMSDSNI